MANRPHPESERPLHGPLQSFDLNEEVARLREENEQRQGGRRNAITLRKGEGLSVVLLVMSAGDKLDEHAAPGPIAVEVREGRIRFTAEEETVEVERETVLTCDAGVRHAVEALDDAVCVVTIASGKGSPVAG